MLLTLYFNMLTAKVTGSPRKCVGAPDCIISDIAIFSNNLCLLSTTPLCYGV